jgi:hypothetical protein
MNTYIKCMSAVCGLLLVSSAALLAQGNKALIDALVKKGVLSSKEASEIQADMARQYADGPDGKLELAKHVTKLKLYGQVRWRYQWNQAETQPPVSPTAPTIIPGPQAQAFRQPAINAVLPSNTPIVLPTVTQNVAGNLVPFTPPAANPNVGQPFPAPQQSFNQDRARYLFKFGATYDFTDNFSSGIEFASATANDSYNQTIGSAYGRFPVSLSLLYLTWEPTDWLTLTGGKQLNPLYTTSLVWDSDINPEGVTEEFWWDITDAFGIGFTAGQWVYSNDISETQLGFTNNIPFNTSDEIGWQFVQQVPMQYRFLEYVTETVPADDPKDMKAMKTITKPKEIAKITFAPGFMTYTGSATGFVTGGGTTANAIVNTSSPAFLASNGTNDLNIVTAPGDFKTKFGSVPFQFYWDFAWNIDGKDRIQNVYLAPFGQGDGRPAIGAPGTVPAAAIPGSTAGSTLQSGAYRLQNLSLEDEIAWLVGVKFGQNKKKGDWSASVDFRQVGAGSVDPNLSDSDFALGQLNQQGIRAALEYNFTDFLTGAVTYFNTWDYKQDLWFPPGTAGSGQSAPPPGTTAGFGNNNNLTGVNTTQIVQVDLKWKF